MHSTHRAARRKVVSCTMYFSCMTETEKYSQSLSLEPMCFNPKQQRNLIFRVDDTEKMKCDKEVHDSLKQERYNSSLMVCYCGYPCLLASYHLHFLALFQRQPHAVITTFWIYLKNKLDNEKSHWLSMKLSYSYKTTLKDSDQMSLAEQRQQSEPFLSLVHTCLVSPH